jgi:hypothetical protein
MLSSNDGRVRFKLASIEGARALDAACFRVGGACVIALCK